jgi:hypothetical protein
MGRGCRAGGSCNGDDLEKAGSGGFNGVDCRKASSGGFLETAAKKKERMQKKRKEKREKKHRIFDLLSGLSLVDVYYYRPL